MEPIDNLVPGSRITAWYFNSDTGEPKESVFELSRQGVLVENKGRFGGARSFTWDMLSENAISAIDAEIRRTSAQIVLLYGKKHELEALKDKYTDPEILKARREAEEKKRRDDEWREWDRLNSPG